MVIKGHEPLHLKEEVLAPWPLPAIQTSIRSLTQVMASMKQEMATFKKDSATCPRDENPLWRDSDEDRKC